MYVILLHLLAGICTQNGDQDYVDACERLSQLNLSEIQQREIVRVILHCCGNVWNLT